MRVGFIRSLARGARLRVGRWRVHGTGADGHAGTDAAARRCPDTKPARRADDHVCRTQSFIQGR